MNNNNKFIELGSLEFDLPRDYDHKHQLAKFIASQECSCNSHLNAKINDDNFPKVSRLMTEGESYIIKFWSLKSGETAEASEWSEFLKNDGAISTGIKYLTVAWEQNAKDFPLSKYILSLNEPYNDDGDIRRPGIQAFECLVPEKRCFRLGLVCFSPSFDNNCYFFGIYKKK